MGAVPPTSPLPPVHAAPPSVSLPPEGAGATSAHLPEVAVPTPVATHIHTAETRVAVGSTADDDLQTSYYRVYQEFVLARERCQESVEGLNFELFRQRLQQSRDQIMTQHSCHTVQFHVHIKDGRATLRATPIWT